MRPGDRPQYDDWAAPRSDAESRREAVGPQGAALILELQRLRHAFELEDVNEAHAPQVRRPARDNLRPAGRQLMRQPKRQQKGRMGRAINVCLEQFGFHTAAQLKRTSKYASEPGEKLAPRQRSIVTLDSPISMDTTRPGPEIFATDIKQRSTPIDAPPLALQRPQEKVETSVGQLIERCRIGVTAGVAFLVNRDGLAHHDNAQGDSLASRTGRSFEHELRTGLRVLIVAGLLGGGWIALMPLAGAVVVPGNLVVQSNVKTIQHPTGGVVAEIAVHNGMRVSAGDLLVRLDATQAQASLQVVSKQLDELRARIARLVAERDGLSRPEVPAELLARLTESTVNTLLASEETIFKARANARESQKDLLQSRIAQLGQEIGGLDAQVVSKAKQLELIEGELSGVQELYDKRLVPLTRLMTLQRETARIEGERGQLISAIAETKSKIGEAQLQIVRLDQDFRSDVVKELGETRGKEAELVERGVAARDLLDRIDIRAPTSGLVHQLSAHTIGGVIRAGDPIMEVVPDSDDLQIEARMQPNDIDQVRTGQKAFVRFSAFNQRVTPQLAGIVSYVSADTSHDQQSNASYFTVRVTLPEDEHRRLAGLQLVSGMPAEVFMQTGSRTMLSYLLKPIADQLQRAFVER
ncbi:HlyD family type I secretion periplasmic adaptor subunit [Bradyrhizobium sp.]|uniref:HlyD family type I secretion periplasmic adaptor subunit n=2 Tax=Bradyrhizobium sp. TaxID=376 RepID=UPI003C71DF39